MPQMQPMNWILIYFMNSMLLCFIFCMIYFLMSYKQPNLIKEDKIKPSSLKHIIKW